MLKSTDYTLLDAPAGSTLKVTAVHGGGAVRSRLYALGIMPGAKLDVFKNCQCGASRRVQVRGSSMIIGAGMAEKVMCEVLGPSDAQFPHSECMCASTHEPVRPAQTSDTALHKH